MKYFKIDLNEVLKVKLIGKETLSASRVHYTRDLIEYLLYVVVKGELRLRVNGDPVVLMPGDMYLFQSGDFQAPDGGSNCEYYYVHFVADRIEQIELTDNAYLRMLHERSEMCRKTPYYEPACYTFMYVCVRQQTHIDSKSQLNYIVSLLKNHKTTPESKMAEERLSISYALSKVFMTLEKTNTLKNKSTDQIAWKIADYIDENYFRSISGEDIEKEFFLNFDYANRIFKKAMGISIVKYRNDVRIQYAKASMLTANKALKEVAAEVGFESAYYFSRIFKKSEGISPSEYKQKFANIVSRKEMSQ